MKIPYSRQDINTGDIKAICKVLRSSFFNPIDKHAIM